MTLIERARQLRPLIVKAAQSLEDNISATCPELYDEWDGNGIDYPKGYKIRRNGKVYRVITAHKSQLDWTPETVASLFEVIDETHVGTLEDPIPYDGNMEIFVDLYYIQNNVIYKCIRSSGVALHHNLADLVGNYVEIVE